VDFEDGNSQTVSASELYDLVFTSGKNLILSANGTIFTGDKQGIIPGLLSRWYSERKELQAEAKAWLDLITGGISLDTELLSTVISELGAIENKEG